MDPEGSWRILEAAWFDRCLMSRLHKVSMVSDGEGDKQITADDDLTH